MARCGELRSGHCPSRSLFTSRSVDCSSDHVWGRRNRSYRGDVQPEEHLNWVTPSAQRSRNMAAVKRANTRPEVRLRSALHAAGFRFRKDLAVRIDGRLIRPDVAFTRRRVAVFIDGCFWHSCPTHGEIPATNIAFWTAKLKANASRDRRQTELLTAAGWLVIRIWEHEPLEAAVAIVASALKSRCEQQNFVARGTKHLVGQRE
jgi:DNA mismatch endonuclease (patch repair protein)